MRLWSIFLPSAALAFLGACRANASVIDDFLIGPIDLEENYAPGSETATQIGLNTAHVIGGSRGWHLEVGKLPQFTPSATAAVRMGVSQEPVGHLYYQADDGLTAITSSIIYDARTSSAPGPGLALDMAAEGHNAIVWEFNRAVFDDDLGYLTISATLTNGVTVSRFKPNSQLGNSI